MSMVKNISMRSLFTALSYYSKHEASCFLLYGYQSNAKGNEVRLKMEKKYYPVAQTKNPPVGGFLDGDDEIKSPSRPRRK